MTDSRIKEQAKQIERSVAQKDSRNILRVLRTMKEFRKLDERVLAGVKKTAALPLIPELNVYFNLLILVNLIEAGRHEEAVKCSDQLMQIVKSQNRRTLDALAAKCYYFHTRCYELTGQLYQIKSFLHSRLRTATLRNDFEGQAVLLNCLLRLYLHYSQYDQASKQVSKSVFPESASNNEWARFLYYLGRIKAIQLEYSDAHKNLLQAIRKAPQNGAIGFKQTVHKLAIIVELLMGEIPDRSLFREPTLRRSLAPYFQLTQAVRSGDLNRFGIVIENYGPKFQADHTFTLIIRLRHNVIKTGMRMISLSYSRIYLADIAKKLNSDDNQDAEYIAAKAIRDGVIEAKINHEGGFLQSKETTDVYCTPEPQAAFHQRIAFCLDIYNQSIKAMRFPLRSYHADADQGETTAENADWQGYWMDEDEEFDG
jgi:26S proteasome regulatory subunit N3